MRSLHEFLRLQLKKELETQAAIKESLIEQVNSLESEIMDIMFDKKETEKPVIIAKYANLSIMRLKAMPQINQAWTPHSTKSINDKQQKTNVLAKSSPQIIQTN